MKQEPELRRFLIERVYVDTQLVDVLAANKDDARALALGRRGIVGRVLSRTRYVSGQKYATRVWPAPPEHIAAHPVDVDGEPVLPELNGHGLLGRRPGRAIA